MRKRGSLALGRVEAKAVIHARTETQVTARFAPIAEVVVDDTIVSRINLRPAFQLWGGEHAATGEIADDGATVERPGAHAERIGTVSDDRATVVLDAAVGEGDRAARALGGIPPDIAAGKRRHDAGNGQAAAVPAGRIPHHAGV